MTHPRGDEALIVALAAGKTHREAADAAGVARRTVTRRLADPAFVAAVRQARGAMVEQALGRMSDSLPAAADTLRELLDAAQPPATRLGAARSLIELRLKVAEVHELEARIAALETGLGGRA